MKFIGMGSIVVDYYYEKNKYLGRMNGKSWENIIINLSYLGEKTKIYGTVGMDETVIFDLQILDNLKIESEIKNFPKNTNRIYCIDGKSTKEYNGIRYWIEDKSDYHLKIEKEDILVVDNVTKNTLRNLEKVDCEKVLDLGRARNFIYLDTKKITSLLQPFVIININEKAYKIIKNKFNVTLQELCTVFDLKLLIVTFGKKGISFATKELEKKYILENPFNEIDDNCAVDSFFSIILK